MHFKTLHSERRHVMLSEMKARHKQIQGELVRPRHMYSKHHSICRPKHTLGQCEGFIEAGMKADARSLVDLMSEKRAG